VVTLVVYDVPEDRVRDRVAEGCKDYGLKRIQYSAFTGDLNRNRRQELYMRLRRELGGHDGNIRIYVISDRDLGLMQEIQVGTRRFPV